MKLTTLLCSPVLLTLAFAADPATTASPSAVPMKAISEKALAAHKEALAIEGLLKGKSPDMAAAAARAEALDQHVTELQEATRSLEQSGTEVAKMRASVDVLKVLTEQKAKRLPGADASERSQFRATAKNIAMRAEQILKTSQKIGG